MASYHALFGAGRLGLGLVLPALRSLDTPVVVFQRMSADSSVRGWDNVTAHDWVDVVVNSLRVARLRCLLGKEEEVTDEELKQLLHDGTSLLVNCRSASRRLERIILAHVRSCSAVVQPQDLHSIGECLSVHPSLHCKLFVVANDSNAIKAFADQLKAVAGGVEVVPVSADRICFSRKLESGRIQVECEQFGGSMGFFLEERSPHDAFPFTPAKIDNRKDQTVQISVARTPIEQQFYEERKAYLLNGVHFVMAVLSYDVLLASCIKKSRWAASPLLIWQRSSASARDIEVFVSLHIHRLATLYGKDRAALRDYAETVMKRIQCTPDTLGRVLNLNDVARVRSKFDRYVRSVMLLCERQESEDSDIEKLMREGRQVLARLESKLESFLRLGPTRLVPQDDRGKLESCIDQVGTSVQAC